MTNESAIKIANRSLADRTYWLSVYTACQLHKLAGAPSFDEFYQDPWTHLEQAGQSGAPSSMDAGHEPLLPAQAAVAQRLDDHDAIKAYLERENESQAKAQPEPTSKAAAANQGLADLIPLTAFARPDRT